VGYDLKSVGLSVGRWTGEVRKERKGLRDMAEWRRWNVSREEAMMVKGVGLLGEGLAVHLGGRRDRC
jgi:hypothetical protein